MKWWSEILVGLLLVLMPIWFVLNPIGAGWSEAALEIIKGGIVIGIILIGILFVMLGISDIKQ